jgi:hypothetical protein
MQNPVICKPQNDLLLPAVYAAPSTGPFRLNVQTFLAQHATSVGLPPGLPHTAAWVVPLAGAGAGMHLHVYRETHGTDAESAVCDQCRIIGTGTTPLVAQECQFAHQAKSTDLCKVCSPDNQAIESQGGSTTR